MVPPATRQDEHISWAQRCLQGPHPRQPREPHQVRVFQICPGAAVHRMPLGIGVEVIAMAGVQEQEALPTLHLNIGIVKQIVVTSTADMLKKSAAPLRQKVRFRANQPQHPTALISSNIRVFFRITHLHHSPSISKNRCGTWSQRISASQEDLCLFKVAPAASCLQLPQLRPGLCLPREMGRTWWALRMGQ